MPSVCTQRHGRSTNAPSSERRPSSPRERVALVSATSADASTRALHTSQAMADVLHGPAHRFGAGRVGGEGGGAGGAWPAQAAGAGRR